MRKPGWYWVKVIDGGKWGCFLWNGSAWEGESDRYSDEMFDVVGPRIPTPDEPWDNVPAMPTDTMLEVGELAESAFSAWMGMKAAAPKP